jgi:hypothetical protein
MTTQTHIMHISDIILPDSDGFGVTGVTGVKRARTPGPADALEAPAKKPTTALALPVPSYAGPLTLDFTLPSSADRVAEFMYGHNWTVRRVGVGVGSVPVPVLTFRTIQDDPLMEPVVLGYADACIMYEQHWADFYASQREAYEAYEADARRAARAAADTTTDARMDEG